MKKHLINFVGRIGRKEYLISFIAVTFFFGIVNYLFSTYKSGFINSYGTAWFMVLNLFVVLVAIYCVFFQAGLVIRRLHDFNKSGWWYLLFFVPIVNIIFLITLIFIKGTAGPNQYDLKA